MCGYLPNDWQSCGNAKKKGDRGKNLREEVERLPAEFRQTETVCYGRLKLHKSKVWELGTDEELSETTSAFRSRVPSESSLVQARYGEGPKGHPGA